MLEIQADALGLKARFIGHVSQEGLPDVYAAANTLVLPSTTEVWGLVVNEALACGLHVVVSERAGVASSIVTMPHVYLCSPTVDAIAAGMDRSRRDWIDYVEEHPILRHTPQLFATQTLDAIERALRRAH